MSGLGEAATAKLLLPVSINTFIWNKQNILIDCFLTSDEHYYLFHNENKFTNNTSCHACRYKGGKCFDSHMWKGW